MSESIDKLKEDLWYLLNVARMSGDPGAVVAAKAIEAALAELSMLRLRVYDGEGGADGEVKRVCENCGGTGWQSEDPDYVPGGHSPCSLCDAYSKRLSGEVKP